MANEKAKVKVKVELKNGDYHSMECSTIDFDEYGIEFYGTNGTNVSIKYKDIGSLGIDVEFNDTLMNLTSTFAYLPIGREEE